MEQINHREQAANMADVNPQAALVHAILDLASAVRENGTDLEKIAKHHEQLATEVGGVAQSITDVSRELVK